MSLDKFRTKLKHFEFEIFAYFSVYIAYISYGLWALYGVRDQVLEITKFEFEPGWKFVGRLRDNTNDELSNYTLLIQKAFPFYVLHVLVSVLVRRYCPAQQSIAQSLLCIAALTYLLKLQTLLVITILLFSFYTAAKLNSKILIYLLTGLWMYFLSTLKHTVYWYKTLGHEEYVYLILLVSWSNLRCTSYALNRINDETASAGAQPKVPYALEYFLGYTLYLPCIFYGPFLSYQRYIAYLQPAQQVPSLVQLILTLIWQLLRVAFWYFTLCLALHFIYVHYMTHDYRAIALLGSAFTQYAVVYFMGQFFFIFYIICYGVGIAMAQFDGLNPPNRPRCIGRVHFYSDMWKHFDQGLYEFLFQYIYAELCGKHSPRAQKIFATVATFAFAVLWHGCYKYVLVWSALNFCCVIAEKYFLLATNSRWYADCVVSRLGIRGAQRLRALLGTQLFIPAAFSNVYFFAGMQVGNYLMHGAYMSGLGNYLALTMCSYCFFQCSEVILNLSKNKTDLSCKAKSVSNDSNDSNNKVD